VGELLGVLLPELPISAAAMDSIRAYVSEWGVDPAGDDTPPTTELQSSHFINNFIAPIGGVALAENPGKKVRAVGFQVEYSDDRKLWFCDIDMDPGNLYFPFVRLALARLQPDSVQPPKSPEDVRLSRVVKTEFAQLTADRTATLGTTKDTIEITLSGLTAQNEVALTLPVHIPPKFPVGLAQPSGPGKVIGGAIGRLQFKLDHQAGAGHVVKAHIEKQAPVTRVDKKEPLGWQPVGGELTLQSYTLARQPEVFWRGPLQWTDRNPSFKYRLVIREFELYYTDPEVAVAGLPVFNPEGRPIGERLVHLDTIPLKP
jgi:hypothetical protein